MKERTRVFVTVAAFLLLFAGMASAEEQWLQYRKAPELYRVLGSVSVSMPEMEKDAPERKRDKRTYYFDQEVAGRMRETVNLTRNGSRPAAPKLNMKDAKGAYNRN